MEIGGRRLVGGSGTRLSSDLPLCRIHASLATEGNCISKGVILTWVNDDLVTSTIQGYVIHARLSFCADGGCASKMFRRALPNRNFTVMDRLWGRCRIYVWLWVMMALLVPSLATSGTLNSVIEAGYNQVKMEMGTPVADWQAIVADKTICDPCCAVACAMPGCSVVPLASMLDVVRHSATLSAVRFYRGDQASAGIGAPPGLRPPIRTIAG